MYLKATNVNVNVDMLIAFSKEIIHMLENSDPMIATNTST